MTGLFPALALCRRSTAAGTASRSVEGLYGTWSASTRWATLPHREPEDGVPVYLRENLFETFRQSIAAPLLCGLCLFQTKAFYTPLKENFKITNL